MRELFCVIPDECFGDKQQTIPRHIISKSARGQRLNLKGKKAKPSKFAHVVYSTRRFEEMVDWYQKSSKRRWRIKIQCLLFSRTMTNIIVSRSETRGKEGVNHVAYTYANLGDLLQIYERLKEMGVLPYWRIHHGITLSLYYPDPDGNRMEFQVDACSVEEANAYMQSEAFAANPAGVEFDPEILLAQFRSGAPGATTTEDAWRSAVFNSRGAWHDLMQLPRQAKNPFARARELPRF